MAIVEFDLHGYYPSDTYNGLLTRIAQQAGETGRVACPPEIPTRHFASPCQRRRRGQ
jgi:hypothetical protein